MAAAASRHQRSLSPSGRFCSSSISSSSTFSASSSAGPHNRYGSNSDSNSLLHRASSPTRVNMYGSSQTTSSSSIRVSASSSTNGSFHVSRRPFGGEGKKRTCLCSPTTHPGSFRCNYHKNLDKRRTETTSSSSYALPNRLNMRRSAMTNSLVRIGTVEGGEWVKRALATLIRPSSHQQRRRADFQPRPSRLSVMSKAEDGN